jgi:hypothetical protein
VAAFLACEAETGIRPSTIGRRVPAVRYAHKLAGHAVPTDDERVKATMRGIRRSLGTAARKKSPATAERIISAIGEVTMHPDDELASLRRLLDALESGSMKLLLNVKAPESKQSRPA